MSPFEGTWNNIPNLLQQFGSSRVWGLSGRSVSKEFSLLLNGFNNFRVTMPRDSNAEASSQSTYRLSSTSITLAPLACFQEVGVSPNGTDESVGVSYSPSTLAIRLEFGPGGSI